MNNQIPAEKKLKLAYIALSLFALWVVYQIIAFAVTQYQIHQATNAITSLNALGSGKITKEDQKNISDNMANAETAFAGPKPEFQPGSKMFKVAYNVLKEEFPHGFTIERLSEPSPGMGEWTQDVIVVAYDGQGGQAEERRHFSIHDGRLGAEETFEPTMDRIYFN